MKEMTIKNITVKEMTEVLSLLCVEVLMVAFSGAAKRLKTTWPRQEGNRIPETINREICA